MRAICLVVILWCLSDTIFGADLTLTPQAYGNEVVEAVINLIRENCIFAEDKRYLRRLAYVESRDGSDPKTYRSGYHGGIWQVDETKFIQTQNNPALQAKYDIIRNVFGIDWSRVTWYDLRKPLYSGLAAALYTIYISGTGGMDWRIEQQATFWENYYHDGGRTTNFILEAGVLDEGCHANQAIDLVFLVDGSSSLSSLDFALAREFVKEVVRGFDISPYQTHVGAVLYSTQVSVEFQLNQYYDKQAVIDAIGRMAYSPGSTATAKALQVAVEQVFDPRYGGSRPNVVKVLLLITDGASDDPIGTQYYAEMAHSRRINVFSVGVGSLTQISELNTIASNPTCTHVYKAAGYNEIIFLTDEIKRATCIAPLYINSTYSCSIEKCPPLAYITPPGVVRNVMKMARRLSAPCVMVSDNTVSESVSRTSSLHESTDSPDQLQIRHVRRRGRESTRRGTGRESFRRGTGRESSRGRGRATRQRRGRGIHGTSVSRTEVATTAEARDHQLKERIANMTQEGKDNLLAPICQKYPNMVFEVVNCSSTEQQGYHPRPGGESPSWCICSNCREMPTDEEKQCCKQIPPNCYSRLPDFDLVVLDEVVLLVEQRYRQDVLAAEEDNDYNRGKRHAAYRQFILWTYGYLGSGNRRVIPSCCVWRIRDKYPDSFGQYRGFTQGRLG